MHTLVQLANVNLTLQGNKVLREVSLTVLPRQHLAVTGSNGSGKSSLLRMIRGEAYPDQLNGGQVIWFPPAEDGVSQSSGDKSPLSGRGMTAMVSPLLQNMFMRQSWELSGLEIILAGLSDDFFLYTKPAPQYMDRAEQTAKLLGAQDLLVKPISAMSQGQMRLILLLRALIKRPALLLLDEATDGLDQYAQRTLLTALAHLVEQTDAPTLILAGHRQFPDFIRSYVQMDQGVLSGPFPVKTNPIIKGSLTESAPVGDRTPEDKPKSSDSGLDIRLDNVSVFIDRQQVLFGLNWQVTPQQRWLITGANGSGKSTLLRLILGGETVALGGKLERLLHGCPLNRLEEIQRHIRLVSDQLQALYSYDESAADVVFSGFDGSIGVYREPDPAEREHVENLLRQIGLLEYRDRPFFSLSTGQARRILLARALAGNPGLLLLDEPFSGLDQASQRTIREILECKAAQGLQIIMVSHHPQEILACITDTAFMHEGKLSFPDQD